MTTRDSLTLVGLQPTVKGALITFIVTLLLTCATMFTYETHKANYILVDVVAKQRVIVDLTEVTVNKQAELIKLQADYIDKLELELKRRNNGLLARH